MRGARVQYSGFVAFVSSKPFVYWARTVAKPLEFPLFVAFSPATHPRAACVRVVVLDLDARTSKTCQSRKIGGAQIALNGAAAFLFFVLKIWHLAGWRNEVIHGERLTGTNLQVELRVF